MKKLFYLIIALVTISFTSCEKEPIGGTATQSLAGQWVVWVDGYDTVGDSVVIENFNGGACFLITYNTAANDPNQFFVSDQGGFWDFVVRIACDPKALTFGDAAPVENESYPCNVTLTNGKIVPNGTKTPSGMPADYIQFDINFDDDDMGGDYAGMTAGEVFGFDVYRVYGYRYTGLVNDEP